MAQVTADQERNIDAAQIVADQPRRHRSHRQSEFGVVESVAGGPQDGRLGAQERQALQQPYLHAGRDTAI